MFLVTSSLLKSLGTLRVGILSPINMVFLWNLLTVIVVVDFKHAYNNVNIVMIHCVSYSIHDLFLGVATATIGILQENKDQ